MFANSTQNICKIGPNLHELRTCLDFRQDLHAHPKQKCANLGRKSDDYRTFLDFCVKICTISAKIERNLDMDFLDFARSMQKIRANFGRLSDIIKFFIHKHYLKLRSCSCFSRVRSHLNLKQKTTAKIY